MQDKSEHAPEPAGMTENVRGSVYRASHVWSNSKRNFVEDDPEYAKLKASLAKPDDLKELQDRNEIRMQNIGDGGQDHRYQQQSQQQQQRLKTTQMMLGRAPQVVDRANRYKPRRQKRFAEENFDENESLASGRSTNRDAARDTAAQKQTMKRGFNMAEPNIIHGDHLNESNNINNNSRLNQSMVSDKNRYSRFLDEQDVEVQIVDDNQLQVAELAAEGDKLEDPDNRLYSEGSDARSNQKEGNYVNTKPLGSELHNESKHSSQIESIDKSGLSRQSHYIGGSQVQDPYEGGKKIGNSQKDDRDAAGQKAMNLFKHNDPLNQNHVNDVGQEMRDRGSKEKTGYMEKEAEFSKQLKNVQMYHIDICRNLMKIAIFAFFLEWVYSIFCIIYFGCVFGDCPNNNCDNQLICFIHYIKFAQTLFVMNNYKVNIQENQPNHPISTLNTFLVILLYYVCLYRYVNDLKQNIDMVNFCVVYPVVDLVLILISFYAIWKVKQKSKGLIANKKFKEYNQEAEQALQDILYLPQEFESDDGEEDF